MELGNSSRHGTTVRRLEECNQAELLSCCWKIGAHSNHGYVQVHRNEPQIHLRFSPSRAGEYGRVSFCKRRNLFYQRARRHCSSCPRIDEILLISARCSVHPPWKDITQSCHVFAEFETEIYHYFGCSRFWIGYENISCSRAEEAVCTQYRLLQYTRNAIQCPRVTSCAVIVSECSQAEVMVGTLSVSGRKGISLVFALQP